MAEGEMREVGTFRLTLPGPMLRRGFWLYVWRVMHSDESVLLYVGRTGDNSSPNASPPYIRMGQHLGSLKNQNALRAHLVKRNIAAEECRQFDLIAHGPVHAEIAKPKTFRHGDKIVVAKLMELHKPLRDIVGAMEKRLAFELRAAGYDVMNVVKWPHDVAESDWLPVKRAFAVDFPKLRAVT